MWRIDMTDTFIIVITTDVWWKTCIERCMH